MLTQSTGLSCARSSASLFASASVSPRERRTHFVFDELFARPRTDPRLPQLRVVWWSPSTTRFELSLHFGMVVNSAVPRLWPLWCVAGNTSSLKPPLRRSISKTANCTSRLALLCLVSRDHPQWSRGPCARGHPSRFSRLSTVTVCIRLSLSMTRSGFACTALDISLDILITS